MPKGKIQEIFPEKFELKKKLEKDWQYFIYRDTYLISKEKQKYFKEINQFAKFPRSSLFNFKIRGGVRRFRKDLHDLIEEINNYNQLFIENRLKEYSTFLEGKDDGLEYPLDEDQRLAVIKDDKHNLVIAGAGSGKTSVISSKIAYLIRRKDKVDKDKILAIAFTRVAADEMRTRLLKDYNIDINISTFHALGRSIIEEETNQKPKLLFNGNERKQFELIENLFSEVLKDRKYQDILIDYLAYHSEQEVEEESFEDKEEYFLYMQNKRYTTLNDNLVKSISERDIGNFLFLNSIEFEYEPYADWVDESEEDKEYHPDFYLPKYNIYIEHWGLNQDLEVPEWFTTTTKEYLDNKKWKLAQFKKHEKVLIETWDYERLTGDLIPNLKEKLIATNPEIKFTPLSYEELIEKTFEFKEKRDEITNLIGNFIKIAKCNFFTVKDIETRIKAKKYSKKQKLFGQLALEVYKRYQDYLKNEDKIDFNDMINLAVDLAKKNPEKYQNKYKHVLVDEFQDISYQRLELIKCFVNENSNTKLFCVGDDWQSIYQFTGSDVRFFVNFKDYFPNPEISYLNKNYRSTQTIVEMSNDLISNNQKQIAKEAYSTGDSGQQPIFFDFTKRFTYSEKEQFENIYNLIDLLLSNGVDPHEIMVLSRFNKYLKDLEIFCGARKVPTEGERGGVRFYSAHKSKGSESEHVILTDVTSGLYGFPCEIQDSSVMELAKRFETDGFIDEERRLFYVALTRSKKFLYVFSLENNNSMFLSEINPYLIYINFDRTERWNDRLPDFLSKYIKGLEIEMPLTCPECGKFLVERTGQYGRFLGCTGYPNCRYTFNLIKKRVESKGISTKVEVEKLKINELPRNCPNCGRKLALRKGKYGGFLGCTGYPSCKFTFNITGVTIVICPKCGNQLFVRSGRYGTFLGCSNYPKCHYTFDFKQHRKKLKPYKIFKYF